MIALACSIGPRVHEITRLRLTDIRPIKDQDPAHEITIIGKGNKQRLIAPVMRGGAARYLQAWLTVRGDRMRSTRATGWWTGIRILSRMRRTRCWKSGSHRPAWNL